MGLFSSLTEPAKAKYKKVKEDGCVVVVSVEVPSAKVEEETQNSLVRIQQRAKVPGFRPGKAPIDVVKKQFAGHAQEDALDHMIRHHVPEALRELSLRPVAAPSVEDVKWEPGKPLKFAVRVEVAPQFTPKDYAKIPVKRKAHGATDEALAKRLEELREANARLEAALEDAVAATHYVLIDYEGFRDGKAIQGAKGDSELVDMSSDQTLEGLAKGLTGAKRGETREVPVSLGGKPALLKATVKEIKRKVLPALDGEFAKDLGFAGLDELKAKLKEVMDEEGRAQSEREVTQQIEEALLKANRIPLPPSLVEAQLEHMIERLRQQLLGGKGQFADKQLEDLREKLRARAEDEVRISYLLPAIAEKEKIEALDSDVDAELERSLSAAGDDKKDEIKKLFTERRQAISGMIRDRKALAFLREKAVITEEKA